MNEKAGSPLSSRVLRTTSYGAGGREVDKVDKVYKVYIGNFAGRLQ